MFRLLRVLLSLALPALVGALVGRAYLPIVLPDGRAEALGWWGGLALGLAVGLGLAVLSAARALPRNRAAADLVLFSLCMVALADLVAQLGRADVPWLIHAAAGVFTVALLMVLRGLRRRPAAAPGRGFSPPTGAA